MEDLREGEGQFIKCPRTSGGPRTPNPNGLVREENSYQESSSHFFFFFFLHWAPGLGLKPMDRIL